MAKKKEFITQAAFRERFLELFDQFSTRHPIFEPSFFYGFPDDTIRGEDVWYFRVSYGLGEAGVIEYDSTEDNDKPFAVSYDWLDKGGGVGGYDYGGYTFISEDSTAMDALKRLVEKPSIYMQNPSDAVSILFPDEIPKGVSRPSVSPFEVCNLSLFEAIRRIEEWKTNGLYRGCPVEIATRGEPIIKTFL